VVTLPLVGSVPLQPPEAMQVRAFIALHCNVAGLPATTLLLVATSVTAVILVPLPVGSLIVVWPDDDC
jgi:hypothetical protein